MCNQKSTYQKISMNKLLQIFAAGILFAASVGLEPTTKKYARPDRVRQKTSVRRRETFDDVVESARRHAHHRILAKAVRRGPADEVDYVAATGLSRDVQNDQLTKIVFARAFKQFHPRASRSEIARVIGELADERNYLSAQISDDNALSESRMTSGPIHVDQRLKASGLDPKVLRVRHSVIHPAGYRRGVDVDLGVDDIASLSGSMAQQIAAGGDLHRIEVSYKLMSESDHPYRTMIGTVFFRPGYYCAEHFVGQSEFNAELRDLLRIREPQEVLFASLAVHHPTNGATLDTPGAITVNNVSYGRPVRLGQWAIAEFSTLPVKGYSVYGGAGSPALAELDIRG